MEITDVRVRVMNKDDSKLKGFASITFDECFVVHDIKILQGNDGLFIRMPNRMPKDGGEPKDIAHPLKTETREMIIKKVLDKYKEEANKEVTE